MRVNGWAAGMMVTAVTLAGAQAADYSGPYPISRGYNPRGYIGECVLTRVAEIGPVPGIAEPAIRFEDGVVESYDGGMLGQIETRPGDPIQLCLVSFSRDCGDDDLPGRTYATGNLRTGAAWTQPDIRSSCTRR